MDKTLSGAIAESTYTYEVLKPLIEFCKAGKLFDVQAWIASGKPVNLPPNQGEKRRKKSPLEVAIDTGFHSLAQVLLEGGAAVETPRYSAFHHALTTHRLDMVELMVKHGADIHSVDMTDVFGTWRIDIIEFFIRNGADLETGNPLAYALSSRIWPAITIFKRYKDRFPSFQDQINSALRDHCEEGNLKWVSLMLWAGADPYQRGADLSEDSDADEGYSALELAALYGRTEILKLKAMRLDPTHPIAGDVLLRACHNDKADPLKILLDKGFDPKRSEDGGTFMIQALLSRMSWDWDYKPWFGEKRQKVDIDSSRARENIKMIHMLVRHGARWEPKDARTISDARSALARMKPDYTIEFIWIMSEYNACTGETAKKLVDHPKMKPLLSGHLPRLNEMLASFGSGGQPPE